MISLISSALIMGLSPCQPLAHPPELPVETAVHDEAADLGDETAEQRRVHVLLEKNPLAERRAEASRQLVALRLGERRAGADVGARLAEIRVHQVAKRRDDLAQMIHAAALRDETDEIADGLAGARALGERQGDRPPIERLDPRPR